MHNKRDRTLWMTLLFYALVGPLVGLLCAMVISFLVEAWGPMTDRLAALIPHAPDPSCDPRYTGHFYLRCYQVSAPRQLRYDFSKLDFSRLSAVVVVAYVIGVIPASLSGFFVGAIGMRDGRVTWRHAVAIGTLVGLVTALSVEISSPIFRPQNAILLFSICLTATIICWLLTGRWWRRAEIRHRPT